MRCPSCGVVVKDDERSCPECGSTLSEQASADERGTKKPERPTELAGRSWFGAVKRTVREFKEDDLSDRGAALTYYGVLAIFPALLALVSMLALLGKSTTQPLIDNLHKVAPGAAKDIFTGAIRNLQ